MRRKLKELWINIFPWKVGDRIRVKDRKSIFNGREGKIDRFYPYNLVGVALVNKKPYEYWTRMYFYQKDLERIPWED